MKTGNLKARIARLEQRIGSCPCLTCESAPSLFWWSYFTDGEEPASFPVDRPEQCPGCGRQIRYSAVVIGFPSADSPDDRRKVEGEHEHLHGPQRLVKAVFGYEMPARQTTAERRALVEAHRGSGGGL